MTALDQAFIKAYTPPAPTPGAGDRLPADRPSKPHFSTTPAAVEEPQPEPAGTADEFRPAFQVDHFAWSTNAVRLGRTAGIQLDRLADGLSEGVFEGRKVVALACSRRGEGCTTLLLCAARRLAERGLRVAMVDGDFDNPLLARRLGLLPESGWEDVLAGRQPLTEAVIESTTDRLAALPLRTPVQVESLRAEGSFQPAASLNELRQHYDLVLLDLGALESTPVPSSRWGIDAVVLVHDVRRTPQLELEQTRRALLESGLVEAGVAENFV
jgi:Mrp family chromosome partitioning ATPase